MLCEMRQLNVTPDVVSYNAAIGAHVKGGQWQKALSMVCEIGSCM